MNPRDADLENQRIHEQIDRLVDDELGQIERRELIERLERLPNGWRRCALAFLEAQCWRRALSAEEANALVVPPDGGGFGGMTASTAESPEPARADTPAIPAPREFRSDPNRRPAPSPDRRWAETLLAMAASFLVAFVLGAAWRWGWLGTGAGDGSATGNVPQVAGAAGAPGTFDARGPAALPGAAEPPALARDEATSRPPEAEWEQPRPLGTVRLSVPVAGDGSPRSIELPVVEGDSLAAEWLRDLPAAVPPEVVRAMEHSGMNVEQQRDVLRFRTPDGRALVVPVERVEVTRAAGPKL